MSPTRSTKTSVGTFGRSATLRAELLQQAEFIGARVPVYVELLHALVDAIADDDVLATLERAWAGRAFHTWYDRPLLLLAALRFDARRPGHPLHAWLWPRPGARPALGPSLRAALGPSLRAALALPGFADSIRRRRVQTNEPTRAVAWLWAATALDLQEVTLVDLGCSAGLNLAAPDLAWATPAGPLPLRPPAIAGRVGYDLQPGDVHDDDTVAWLRACVWPGELDRLARLDAAIDVARRCQRRVLHAASLPDVPARLDADLGDAPGFVLAFQSIVRDYLPPAERAAYREGMFAWLARHPGTAAWVELEHDPRGAPCLVEVHRYVAERLVSTALGTCGPHPDSVTPAPV